MVLALLFGLLGILAVAFGLRWAEPLSPPGFQTLIGLAFAMSGLILCGIGAILNRLYWLGRALRRTSTPSDQAGARRIEPRM